VETPLVDLVKLRQDTRYKWTLLVEKDLEQYRKNKIIQIFDHMDRKIEAYLSARPQLEEWYQYLQVFNILRILPYVEDEKEIVFVETTLNDLLPTCN
jgi:hypothetical protein